MSSLYLNIVLPLQQTTTNEPNVIKPWEQNWLVFAIIVAFGLGTILLTWLWARSGRSKYEKKVPFDRTAEDFAGTVQAGYGQIPYFLIAIYVAVGIFIVLYIINSIATGPQY
jgi:hypothetical protein